MKKLTIILFLFITQFSYAQQYNIEQTGLDFVMDSLFNYSTYRGQCGCGSRLHEEYPVYVSDTTDFNPNPEIMNAYFSLDQNEIHDWLYQKFSGNRLTIETKETYKVIKRTPKSWKDRHVIVISNQYKNEDYILVEYWLKNNHRCPGIIYSLVFEQGEIIEHQKTWPCE